MRDDVHADEVRSSTTVDAAAAEAARELGLDGGRLGIAGASSSLHVS